MPVLFGRNDLHAYAGASIEPISTLTIAPSLRSEYVSDISDFEVLPQALIKYAPISSLLLTASYVRSFHAPTLNDLYWKGLGNPYLKPERANESQAGIEFTPRLYGIQPKLSATYFYTYVQHEILWLPPPNGGEWRPYNVDVAESKGWELSAAAMFTIDRHTTLEVEESYTLLSAHNLTPNDTDHGRELLYSSPAQSIFIASLSREWGILALAAHYRDREFTDAANTQAGELPAVTTYDVTATTCDFGFSNIGFHLLLSVENLGDVNYEDVLGYPLPGRSYKFSIELNYH